MARPAPEVRHARASDCAALSALCIRAKASNGYDAAFMAACIEDLRVTAEMIGQGCFVCAVWDDELLGCAGLQWDDQPLGQAEVTRFFVDPGAQRQGIGRLLWQALLDEARSRGLRTLTLAADPFAVPFYRAMGFDVTGETPSESIPGRMLPVMACKIQG